MSTTLTQLWNGNLRPVNDFRNSEMTELETLMQRNLNDLEKVLKGKAIDSFEKYSDCVSEYVSIACEQAFCDGFCLATKLLTEAVHNV